MPSAWDANANTNLLISINEIQNPKPPNWKDVAEKMKAKGYDGFTHEACRQHYQKLRKDARTAPIGQNPSTPIKKTTQARGVGSSRKGSSKVTSPFANGMPVDDEEAFETPAKKRKHTALKEEIPIAESSDEGYGGSMRVPKYGYKSSDDGSGSFMGRSVKVENARYGEDVDSKNAVDYDLYD